MACFLVSAAEAVVVTAVKKHEESVEKTEQKKIRRDKGSKSASEQEAQMADLAVMGRCDIACFRACLAW